MLKSVKQIEMCALNQNSWKKTRHKGKVSFNLLHVNVFIFLSFSLILFFVSFYVYFASSFPSSLPVRIDLIYFIFIFIWVFIQMKVSHEIEHTPTSTKKCFVFIIKLETSTFCSCAQVTLMCRKEYETNGQMRKSFWVDARENETETKGCFDQVAMK